MHPPGMARTNTGQKMDETPDGRTKPLERFLRRSEVEHVTGLGRSTIYEKIAVGEFPKPVPLSSGAVGWLESEIAAWQAARIALRGGDKARSRDGCGS